jgi:homoserine dehydrogenase
MKPINVGLLGIGTVGGGNWTVLTRNEAEITRRAGRPIQITKVADKNLELAQRSLPAAREGDRRCLRRGADPRSTSSSN